MGEEKCKKHLFYWYTTALLKEMFCYKIIIGQYLLLYFCYKFKVFTVLHILVMFHALHLITFEKKNIFLLIFVKIIILKNWKLKTNNILQEREIKNLIIPDSECHKVNARKCEAKLHSGAEYLKTLKQTFLSHSSNW